VQVVMLGAGMDTRPWRLALPPGTRWFELDRQDVLAAKQRAMAAAGAAFQGADRAASTGSKPHSSSSGRAYPLLASAWSCASADLQQPGWAAKLLGAGLDTAQPIVSCVAAG
jgi:O-methyltransferase involved in polyketide biosynthesis